MCSLNPNGAGLSDRSERGDRAIGGLKALGASLEGLNELLRLKATVSRALQHGGICISSPSSKLLLSIPGVLDDFEGGGIGLLHLGMELFSLGVLSALVVDWLLEPVDSTQFRLVADGGGRSRSSEA